MANKAVTAALAALTQILGAGDGAAKGKDDSAALADLRKLLDGLGARIDELEAEGEKTGKKIEAWNGLPSGSSQSIAEARDLVGLVDADLDVVRGLSQKLERAKKLAKRVPGALNHVETVANAVDGWRRDLDSDREALLVASRDVLVRDGRNGSTAGVVEIPLPVQVERALADAYQRRDAREGEAAAARMLPSQSERIGVADKLLASIAQDSTRQTELEKRVQGIIDNVRGATSAPPAELRAAADQLKAWGMSLAFEKGRVEQLRR